VNACATAILSRVLQGLATAWVLATLCFVFTHALPGDLSTRIAAARVGEERLTVETADRVRREEGLDRPLARQYLHWLNHLARGDLGRSLISRKGVWEEIAYYGRFTLVLGLIGWILSYLIALPLGIAAGFRPEGIVDHLTTGVAAALASVPTFIVGIGLISFFALSLRWLPPAGSRTSAHMVLPALTLALGLAAFSVRVIRNAVAGVRQRFYMTFARLRGHTASSAFRHHGVRNAAIPVATFAALQLAFLIDGFVVVETLFNYPGLGELLVKALIARDVPVIMGAGLVIGFAYASVNLAADLLCLRLDPRRGARLGAAA
jgi:peptide/nickel transport system permease protein